MATASDIIDRVLDRLEENETNPVFWLRSELLTHLNDGFLEFTLTAGQMLSEEIYNVIGSKFQSVPGGSLAIVRVDYGGQMIEKYTLESLDRLTPTWDNQSGVLTKWAPCGLDHWVIDRQPLAPSQVTLTCLLQPVPLTESSEVDLASEYLEALTDYVFHAARFKESGMELEQSMQQYDSFEDKTGLRGTRTMSEQWEIWARDPNADTGEDYSTIDRS